MKRLFLLCALFSMLAVGCEELLPNEQKPADKPVEQPKEDQTFFTDAEGNYIVSAYGGEFMVVVTTNLEYSVAIPTDAQEWLSVADSRADVREETLTFIVAENDTFDERSAAAELIATDGKVLQTITFVQRGQDKVFESDGKGSYTIKAVGGEVSVAVTTNLEYNVVISEDAEEWLSLADTRAVIRKETLTFIVAENKAYDRRSTTVTLVDNEGNVLQAIEFIQRAAAMPQFTCPSDEIWYTSSDGNIVEPCSNEFLDDVNILSVFGANIISNAYDAEKECWVIKFDGDVTTIGECAFYDCDSLTSVTIPDSVTIIGYEAFGNCSSLQEFKGKFASEDGRCWIIDGVLNSFAPAGLIEYAIPDSVTTIEVCAFCECDSLISVTIPDSVTIIGNYAFCLCDSLTSVTIPNNVTTIGYGAFAGCNSLTEFNGKFASEDGRYLIIDGTLNSFAPAGLTEYTIPDNVTTIGTNAFQECISLTSVTIGDSVTDIGDRAFLRCNSLTSVTIPDSVTSIGDSAFQLCTSLESVTLGKGLTTINDYAFSLCPSLKHVVIPEGVTAIGYASFWDCTSLETVTLPDSVTAIGWGAFSTCESLTSVTIPDSVTTIGDYAFGWCESLTNVYCKATTPPEGGGDMFYSNASGRKIYVPMESVNKYKSASGWSSYSYYIEGYNF